MTLPAVNDKLPIPRKLNQGMITALSEAVAKGYYNVTACQLLHIDNSTLTRWLQLARKDLDSGVDSLYSQLHIALKKAEAISEAKMVDLVRNSAVEKKDGYLGMTYLERRHPDRWGRKDRTRVDINERKAITITHVEVVLNKGDGTPEIIEGESRELKEGSRENTVNTID